MNKINLIAQFYDNDIKHISDFINNLPNIESIHVDDTVPNEKLNVLNYNEYLALNNRTRVYPNSFPKNNKYALLNTINGETTAMPTVGINNIMIKSIIKNYKIKADYKFIFFDWDRTLSVIEGIIYPSFPNKFIKYNIEYDHVLEYLIGSKARINKLKKMYLKLIENNVKVFILTNNCISSKNNSIGNRPEFLNLIRRLFPDFLDNHLISGCDFKFNKINALKSTIKNKDNFGNTSAIFLNKYSLLNKLINQTNLHQNIFYSKQIILNKKLKKSKKSKI